VLRVACVLHVACCGLVGCVLRASCTTAVRNDVWNWLNRGCLWWLLHLCMHVSVGVGVGVGVKSAFHHVGVRVSLGTCLFVGADLLSYQQCLVWRTSTSTRLEDLHFRTFGGPPLPHYLLTFQDLGFSARFSADFSMGPFNTRLVRWF
jgi:uncharacterized membrane protein YgdD (TMEM256/DUF423 family)